MLRLALTKGRIEKKALQYLAEGGYLEVKDENEISKEDIESVLCSLGITDGDTLMVDESSTSAYAVRAIRHLKNITLITNSVELLREIADGDLTAALRGEEALWVEMNRRQALLA